MKKSYLTNYTILLVLISLWLGPVSIAQDKDSLTNQQKLLSGAEVAISTFGGAVAGAFKLAKRAGIVAKGAKLLATGKKGKALTGAAAKNAAAKTAKDVAKTQKDAAKLLTGGTAAGAAKGVGKGALKGGAKDAKKTLGEHAVDAAKSITGIAAAERIGANMGVEINKAGGFVSLVKNAGGGAKEVATSVAQGAKELAGRVGSFLNPFGK